MSSAIFIAVTTDQIAIAVLFIFVVSATAIFIAWWKRSPLTLEQTFMWTINYLIAKLLWNTRVKGDFYVRSNQGAVIVANHASSVDPAFIQTSIRRVIYWLVAREYCEVGIAGWLLRKLQVIPVGRAGIDTAATKQAIRLAQQGGIIGVFPEGRINELHEQLLLPGRPGAALVALKARVPIVPMFIFGSPYDGTPWGPLLMPAKVQVKMGRPMDLTPYYGREKEEGVLQEITLQLLRELARLAGHPDFEPQLAGRRWKTESDENNTAYGLNLEAQNNGHAGSESPSTASQH